VAVWVIFWYEWYNGRAINLAESFSLLSMIFYIFLMVNGMLYGAIMSIFQFFAILQRISEVYMLEEHIPQRQIAKNASSVLIKI